MAGKVVVLEGIDGSGKDTVVKFLKQILEKYNKKYSIYKFPTKETIYGKIIRDFLSKDVNVDPREIAFLFAADRVPFYDKIKRDRDEGKIVILNRWIYSNVAYQGWRISNTLDLNLEEAIKYVISLEPMELGAPNIDYVLYIYIEVENAIRRLEERGKLTSYDKNIKLLQGVKGVFDWMYKNYKEKDPYGAKWIKIDNNGSVGNLKMQIEKFAKDHILL